MDREFQSKVHKVMSSAATETAGLLRQILEVECKGWGDQAEALKRIARECRLSFWTLNNLLIGRRKRVDGDVRDRIRQYFIDDCRARAARLLHDAEMAERSGRGNDDLAMVAEKIRALAAELNAAKGNQKAER